MPLDTGQVADLDFPSGADGDAAVVHNLHPTLESGPSIGAALRAIREARGLSLEEVAEVTYVRRAYLAAIEEMRLDQLPSRPFTVGYIRAYAKALGQDGEAAVGRFKTEEPAPDDKLPEPLGVRDGRDPRIALAGVAGAVIIAAILAWNVAQRVMTEPEPQQAPAPEPAAVIDRSVTAKAGPVALGAPLPPPVESTTPEVYETPGLAAATAADGSADAAEAAAKLAAASKSQEPPAPPPDLPATFVAKGAMFGAEAAAASTVTLQARKAASIIIRGPDGSVYFARQLAPGDAYRAPAIKGLTVDVSEPDSFQVFVSGQTKGLLPAAETPLSKLEG